MGAVALDIGVQGQLQLKDFSMPSSVHLNKKNWKKKEKSHFYL